MGLLAEINSPTDLKRLDQQQLTQLASEVRAFLVEQIAKTGGHCSANLGVVELTFALHRVFDSPYPTLFRSTGHQAYVHKLITGRAADFSRLRQAGGLSGYPSRKESEHDLVENSHASTSLSYAVGIAEARLRKRIGGFVVAVIGDGALTGGMAYEALNQIAHLQPPNLIIVINDNGRSYAPTVGGLARHLSQLRVDPRYESIKDEISRLLRDLPLVGATADQAAYRVKEGLKQLLQPSTVFESLGIKYAGLVDGHDEAALEQVLRRASRLSEPVVVHVVTEKGHGYGPAVEDEIDKLHGVSAFDPLTGRPLRTELTYTDVFGDALLADATELCALLETALGTDGPIAIRYPRGPVPSTPDLPAEALPVGRWEEVRKGSEAVIFATGRMVEIAKEAAERLEAMGLSCGVVNARWTKPVDTRLGGWG